MPFFSEGGDGRRVDCEGEVCRVDFGAPFRENEREFIVAVVWEAESK